MPQYSAAKTLKKAVMAVVELVASVLLTMLPQFVELLLSSLDEPGEIAALHVPVTYVPFVLFGIRAATNWYKNRSNQ